MEVFFILGPGLAAVLVAAPWPGTGLLVAAVAAVVGTAGFALTAAVRAPIPSAGHRLRLGPLGALARPGVRTVALAGLGFGLVVGGVEVAVPAVTTAAGSQVLGGVLISAWSIVSVAAGVVYAVRPWPRPLHQRLPALLGVFAVLVATMATAAGSLLALAVVMLASGAFITAQLTAQSLALEVATPDGAATEAFGWTVTAITLVWPPGSRRRAGPWSRRARGRRSWRAGRRGWCSRPCCGGAAARSVGSRPRAGAGRLSGANAAFAPTCMERTRRSVHPTHPTPRSLHQADPRPARR